VNGRYRGVLFDLFGTLVLVDPERLPELRRGTQAVRATAAGLGELLARWAPGVTPETFWLALAEVSDEIARARARNFVELPSRERFRRALARVGCDPAVLPEAAVHLSRGHMAMIVGSTVLPSAHREVLRAARAHCRVGVVTNFDDTAAAYEILRRHDLLACLDTVVVSEAIGLRKPHPAPVRAALDGLGLEAHEVLFVGDTFHEDVAAAHAAGVDSVWIDARGEGPPAGERAPRHVVRALSEMAALVARP
jgi:FMN phosphatase YigB (HAD superfamily)